MRPFFQRIPFHRKKATDCFAFTLLEILACILLISILAALLVPSLARSFKRSAAAACSSNLRQIGNGINLYAADNDGEFPIMKDDRTNPDGSKMPKNYWYAGANLGGYVGYPKAADGMLDTTGRVFVCPGSPREERKLGSYLPNTQIFLHRADGDGRRVSPIKHTEVRMPSKTVMMLEGYSAMYPLNPDLWSKFSTSLNIPGRMPHGPNPPVHIQNVTTGDAMNVLFVDGHVELIVLKKKPQPTDPLAWPGNTNNITGPDTTSAP